MKRVEILISGIVQGVGFRPFVYRTASAHNISGFVKNTVSGVLIEAQGEKPDIDNFILHIRQSPPASSKIKGIHIRSIPLKKESGFRIFKSNGQFWQRPEIPPDIAICSKCSEEILNSKDRRYFYPFTNCVDCGPRFTIIKSLSYDRENTSMEEFRMCAECAREYRNPDDRRFHAQTNCCEKCGPTVFLTDSEGSIISRNQAAIRKTAELIADGKIFAIKGIDGFHLVCDAFSLFAIKTLRDRKKREEKPFAVMARNLETIEKYCFVSRKEKEFLTSGSAPIMLLRKKENPENFEQIAPKNRYLGVMLPYSGIHHLIFECEQSLELLVMTSGNYSEQPICTDNKQALRLLSDIVDFFLFHNREIISGCDDSVMRVLPDHKPLMIRRSRGFSPESIQLPFVFEKPVLACGGNIKNTFSVAMNNSLYMSHHIGDLDNPDAFDIYALTIDRYLNILKIKPEIIAYDAHPEYNSTMFAVSQDFFPDAVRTPVYHHHAHICSCMVENKIENRTVIGVAFDGTGYGEDDTLWGGEFLLCDYSGFERKAHLRPVKLPGGELAIKQIWRIALSFVMDAFDEGYDSRLFGFLKEIDVKKIEMVKRMIETNVNCPYSSGLGRFFDAVSCICGLRTQISFEGQAAAELESVIKEDPSDRPYKFDIVKNDDIFIIDHRITIREIVRDIKEKKSAGQISHRFHLTVIRMVYEICTLLHKQTGIKEVVLSGGSFQNVFLSVNVRKALERAGFTVYSHTMIPPNDACISVGQCAVAGSFNL